MRKQACSMYLVLANDDVFRFSETLVLSRSYKISQDRDCNCKWPLNFPSHRETFVFLPLICPHVRAIGKHECSNALHYHLLEQTLKFFNAVNNCLNRSCTSQSTLPRTRIIMRRPCPISELGIWKTSNMYIRKSEPLTSCKRRNIDVSVICFSSSARC